MSRVITAGKVVPVIGFLAIATQPGSGDGGTVEVPSDAAAVTATDTAPITKALGVSGGYYVSRLAFAGDSRSHVGVVGQRNGWRKVVAETTIANATDAPHSWATGPLPGGLNEVQGAPSSANSGGVSDGGEPMGAGAAAVASARGSAGNSVDAAAVWRIGSASDGARADADDDGEEAELIEFQSGLKGYRRARQSAKRQVVVEVADLRSRANTIVAGPALVPTNDDAASPPARAGADAGDWGTTLC